MDGRRDVPYMWLDVLRTWRQLAREILEHRAQCDAIEDGPKRAEHIEALRESKSARLDRSASTEDLHEHMFVTLLRRAEEDGEFVLRVRDARNRLDPEFAPLEALRVTLAKQEVPRAGKGMKAYMPAYTRGDPATGSMMWMVEFKDGSSEFIARRGIADGLTAM
jgi:hypothetical protein